MIELCLVTALLGVFVAMAWPEFRALRKGYALESTARDLTDCMAFARASAIAEHDWYKLAFERDRTLYTLYRINVDGGAPSAPVPAAGRWGAGRAISPDIDLEPPAESIFFFPNGTATSATLVLNESNVSSLSIRLNGTLGYAAISP